MHSLLFLRIHAIFSSNLAAFETSIDFMQYLPLHTVLHPGVGNVPTRVGAHQIHMVSALIGIYPWDAAAYLIWKVRVTQGKIENVTILGTILMYTIFQTNI